VLSMHWTAIAYTAIAYTAIAYTTIASHVHAVQYFIEDE
jgi:hypothetical protein